MKKLFIFGIDGATFRLIDAMIARGKLPTFAGLSKKGVKATLYSTIPPYTAPGWVSALTGVGPGTHGIYQFWDTSGEDYVGKYMGSTDWEVPPVWTILNSYGFKTGMINIPMTHPPYKVDGFLLTWPLSKTLRYSYPSDLIAEIAAHGGHFMSDLTSMYGDTERYCRTALEITEKRAVTVEYLVQNKEWDFFMTMFPEVDRVSHAYWHFMDAKSPLYNPHVELAMREAIERVYEAVDQALKRALDCLPADTTCLVMSDHGFGCGLLNFNVQTFFYNEGYLFGKPTTEQIESIDAAVDNPNLNWFYYRDGDQYYEVDWSRTRCYMAAPGSYGVNINLKGREPQGIVAPEEYEALRTELIEKLQKVTLIGTDELLFERVVRSEEVYSGPREKAAPDIMLIPKDYGIMVNHPVKVGQLFSHPEPKGMHREDGIFLAIGPGVKEGVILEQARVEDITPTVLNYFGIPIPEYMEGQVLPLFAAAEATEPAETREAMPIQMPDIPYENSYSPEEKTEIEERLKALGYL